MTYTCTIRLLLVVFLFPRLFAYGTYIQDGGQRRKTEARRWRLMERMERDGLLGMTRLNAGVWMEQKDILYVMIATNCHTCLIRALRSRK